MSRAIFIIALRSVLHRQPTDEELTDFLRELRKRGERLYVPQHDGPTPEQVAAVAAGIAAGEGTRKIAKAANLSRSVVRRLVVQIPACNKPAVTE